MANTVNVQTLYDIGIDITPEMDGGVYGAAVSDCVCKGIGDNFRARTTSGAAQITFNAGSQAIIGGSFFRLTGNCVIDLSNNRNQTFNLYAKIDKGQPIGSIGTFSIKPSGTAAEVGNLNGSDNVREMLLYTVTTDANGYPSTIVDKRTLKENGDASFGGLQFVYLSTKAAYDAIQTKDANTYYFIK